MARFGRHCGFVEHSMAWTSPPGYSWTKTIAWCPIPLALEKRNGPNRRVNAIVNNANKWSPLAAPFLVQKTPSCNKYFAGFLLTRLSLGHSALNLDAIAECGEIQTSSYIFTRSSDSEQPGPFYNTKALGAHDNCVTAPNTPKLVWSGWPVDRPSSFPCSVCVKSRMISLHLGTLPAGVRAWPSSPV